MDLAVFDLTQAVRERPHADTYRHMFTQLDIAERGGMDGYYITEHHFDPGYNVTPAPNLIIAAMSQRTERIRLGVMTTVLPYHHPVRVAEEIRELDMLTNGRLDVALGRGAIRAEQLGFGVDRTQTLEMFEASFDLVLRFLKEERVGRYVSPWWSGEGVVITPEPVQRPHPPLWLTAVSTTSSYKAGRLGLNICTAFRDYAERAQHAASFREGWQEFHADKPLGKYGSVHPTFVGETEAEARRLGQHHIDGWFSHFVKVLSDRPSNTDDPSYETHKRAHVRLLNSTFDQLIEDNRIIFGSPEQCAEQLGRLEDSGVDAFQGQFQLGEMDYGVSTRSLQLFCDEVVPRVRARRKASALAGSNL